MSKRISKVGSNTQGVPSAWSSVLGDGGNVMTESRCVPFPHLLLLQPPQCITDILHVLGGQCHQGRVASPQIHELPRERGENRRKRGCISPAAGSRVSSFTVHDTDEAPLAWEPPEVPGRPGMAPMECSWSAGEGGGHTRHAAQHWSEGRLRPRTLGWMLSSLRKGYRHL